MPKTPTITPHYQTPRRASLADRLSIANSIAEQIWREQQLVSTRMGWNFTSQGVLAAVYVYAGAELDGFEKLFGQLVIALTGVLITGFCFIAVLAAQNQSSRLKAHWINEFTPKSWNTASDRPEPNVKAGPFPQPFSLRMDSLKGRYASRYTCILICALWIMLAGISLWFQFVGKPVVERALNLELSGMSCATAIVDEDMVLRCAPKGAEPAAKAPLITEKAWSPARPPAEDEPKGAR